LPRSQGESADGRSLARTRFDWPAAVAVDDAGVIYVGDSFNNCVRRITQ
jgi:hypothetical protein